ncbi:MAG: hypothetical protein GY950_08275, partial [bacterium]|nr:hypothetical protein [bacterium]
HWDLTDYWFGFDRELNSWAMYDAFSGNLQFTPQGLTAGRQRPAAAADYAGVTFH